MALPSHLQACITQLTAALTQRPDHALRPIERLTLYAAIGPTYASANDADRIALLRSDQLPLTRADRVRARVALLSAQHVLPLWEEVLAPTGMLSAQQLIEEIPYTLSEWMRELSIAHDEATFTAYCEQSLVDYPTVTAMVMGYAQGQFTSAQVAVLHEIIAGAQLAQRMPDASVLRVALDSKLAAHRSMYMLPMAILPYHTLQLIKEVLDGTVAPRIALDQSGDLDEMLGNFLGQDEDTFPARAYDVVAAAAEALNQALGLGPFDHEAITDDTTDAQILGRGAAAAAAHKAASGIFEDTYSTDAFDPLAQQIFWNWWLNEAIPAAWAAEAAAPEAQGPTMPFEQTVRVTAYRYGTLRSEADDSDDAD